FDTGLDGGEFGPTALFITTPVIIQGATGSNGVIIARTSESNFRLFHVMPEGSLTLEFLTLAAGVAQGFAGGNATSSTLGGGGGGSAGLGGAILNQGS